MTFWDTATTEQKLAQIDGGIECGLNASQIAMNCGLTGTQATPARNVVWHFAKYHGRDFSHIGKGNTGFIARRDNAERALERINPDYAIGARSVRKAKRAMAATGQIPEDAYRVFEPANSNDEYLTEWEAF